MICSTFRSETFIFEWNSIINSETEVVDIISDPFHAGNFTESTWIMRFKTTGVHIFNPGKLFIAKKDGRFEEIFLPEKSDSKNSFWDEWLLASELLYPVNIRCELNN